MMEVHQFNVKSLEQTCFEFLKDHLCPENCIGLWQFTNALNIHIFVKLKNEAFQCICENFEEVLLCEEFLQLAVQELADILGQDGLTVTQESTVYQSVLRWINHMPEERRGAIATLLPNVRLGLMNKSYITKYVLNNDVVKTNPESHLLVLNTLQIMSKPSLLCSQPGINNTLFCRRLPNTVLLMVGFTGTIEAFDYRTNSWTPIYTQHNMEDPKFNNPVFLGGYIYVVGGDLGLLGPYNSVWRFNLVTHTWQEMSPMHTSRDLGSVTILNGYIYTMGGCEVHDGPSIRAAEYYRPDINQWTSIEPMNEERKEASCTALNNKIYICGGRKNNRYLNSAEYYNPDTNQWTLITPMGTPRFGLKVVAYMGDIFAVGGRNRSGGLRSAEAYDPVTNTWHNVPEMVHSGWSFGLAVMNNRVFVVSCGPKKIVECYDANTNSWSEVFSCNDLCYKLVSCCVIPALSNVAKFCFPHKLVKTRRWSKRIASARY